MKTPEGVFFFAIFAISKVYAATVKVVVPVRVVPL